ncbi:Regulatory protein RecX [bioreactor metagenome]|uniref:Regulatory protein RecX n=1 Tax=bioreactor metagenome TaxID=1076179 RepID=A0A645A6T6_9ZZZZ
MTDELRVTDLNPTRRGRMSLFVNGEFQFSLDLETLAKSGLSVGDTLSQSALADLREQSDERRAKDKALNYLSLRAYGSAELSQKLCRVFDEDTAAAAVAEMARLGLLDDEAFARRRAAWWQQQGKSTRDIRAKLLALGLPRDLIDAALGSLAGDADEAALRRVIEKQYLAKLARGEREKVLAALARRGFSPRLARAVLADYTQNEAGPDPATLFDC